MLNLLVIVSLLSTIRLGFKYCTANASEGLQVQEPKAEATRVPGRRHESDKGLYRNDINKNTITDVSRSSKEELKRD